MRTQGVERGRRRNCYTCKKLSQCKYENYMIGHFGVKTYQKLHTNWINPKLTQHELNEVDEMKYEKEKLTAREIHALWVGGKVRLGIFDNGHCLPEHFIHP